jgi:S-adenosylmethionine:tRNA ribosyltransferase-isomerase
MAKYTLDDFDYALPEALIAQHPLPERSGSRLLRLAREGLADRVFTELPSMLRQGDVLVFNDTRVIKARLSGRRESGGKVEALVERILGEREALALLRASHAPRPGTWIAFGEGVRAEVIGRHADLFHLRFAAEASVLAILERLGSVPLPPYIERTAGDEDAERYQTVYARRPGAVAAPTAGLHFDELLLERLRATGVQLAHLTLHVGAGTFQPVRSENIDEHRMHSERYEIPQATADAVRAARAANASVVAVGTTSLRALEAAYRDGEVTAGSGETDLFITPGYRFRAVEQLITNFHLPRSTLLMLVAAFAGLEPIRNAYAHAVRSGYRFFSYGDAMLIDRA